MRKDFVSLAEARPDLAKEWNYEKNGDLRPEDVNCGSNKKVWWKLPYDVPDDYPVEHLRGKHFEFEWIALIGDRNSKNLGCPFLSGQSVWNGFNDLASVRPDLAKQWHPTKNGNLRQTEVAVNSMKKVWWLFSYDVPMSYSVKHLRGKHYDFEWNTTVANRSKGNGCPFFNGHAVWSGFNDLQTVNPELAKQWHPTKNGNLKPTEVTANSNKKVWWLLPYDDPKTGKHFDFEWSSTISGRNIESGCPFLYGKAVLKEFNDLQTVNPELAAQWHPTKNSNLRPEDMSFGSNKKVWWLFPYDVPMNYSVKHLRGKHYDFEWQATIVERNNRKRGCPYLSGNAVWKGFNDLATINPELAAQWHPTKNGDLKPTDITSGSKKKVWWLFPYDDPKTGKHFDFEWQASVNNRTKHNSCCPFLNGRAVWEGFNDLQTVNPKLAKQWHPTRNGSLKPTQVTEKSGIMVWWLFPYDAPKTGKHFDFEWKSKVVNRNAGCGCPYLTTYKGEEYIKQYLQKNNIVFNTQQKFSDLLGTGDGQLSYDFSIPDEKYGYILIEYNGIQHYEAVDYFGGEEQFKKQKEHDKRKRDYAKKHGYKLITVKYTYDTYESVEEYLDNELKKLGVINDTKKEESVNDAA